MAPMALMLGLTLVAGQGGGGRWWPDGALFAADFARNRYSVDDGPISRATLEASSFARTTSGFAVGGSSLVLAETDVMRRTALGVWMGRAKTQILAAPTSFASWTKTNAIATDLGEAAPNGATWTRCSASATNGRVLLTPDLTLATSHCISVIVRASGSAGSRLHVQANTDVVTVAEWTWIGDEFGSFTTVTTADGYGAEPLGNGAYLVWVVFTSHAVTAAHSIQFRPDTSGTGLTTDIAQYDCMIGSQFNPPMANALDGADSFNHLLDFPAAYTMYADVVIPPLPPAGASVTLFSADTGGTDINNTLLAALNSDGTVTVEATSAAATVFTVSTTRASLPNTDMRISVLVEADHYEVWFGDNKVADDVLGAPLPDFTRFMVGKDGRSGGRPGCNVSFAAIVAGDVVDAVAADSPYMNMVRLHGQSNADGRGTFGELTGTAYAGLRYRQPDGFIYFAPDAFSADDFTTNAVVARLQVESNASNNLMNSNTGTMIGCEPALMRGRGRNEVLVKYAIGGTKLAADAGAETWAPTETGELYDLANDLYDAAEAYLRDAGYRPRCTGIHWIQGEADANGLATASAYEANLTALIAAWRAYHSISDLPFIIYRLNSNTDSTYRDTVRAAQVAVASAVQHCGLVDLDGVTMDVDNLHYTAPNYQVIGERGRAVEAAL